MTDLIDYHVLYANVVDDGFLDSLGLSESEQKVLRLLYEQRDTANPLYIPDLQIEGLVHDENSPYQALKTLYRMRELRIILYGVAESVPMASEVTYDTLLFKSVVQKAEQAGLVAEGTVKQNTAQRRVATFNLEYPVIYFCLKEEGITLQESLDPLYAAITESQLAQELQDTPFAAILEFLNLMQAMFQQPMTEVPYVRTVADTETEDDYSAMRGGLAPGIQFESVGEAVQPRESDDPQLEKDEGMERGRGWTDSQEDLAWDSGHS